MTVARAVPTAVKLGDGRVLVSGGQTAEMAPLDPLKRGAGDISFVAADVDGLAGLGPYSTGDHAPGEAVDIPSIARQATRAAILMSRLSAEKR